MPLTTPLSSTAHNNNSNKAGGNSNGTTNNTGAASSLLSSSLRVRSNKKNKGKKNKKITFAPTTTTSEDPSSTIGSSLHDPLTSTSSSQQTPSTDTRVFTNTNTDQLCLSKGRQSHFLARIWYQISLHNGVYMLNPTEKMVLNTLGVVFALLVVLYLVVFCQGFLDGFHHQQRSPSTNSNRNVLQQSINFGSEGAFSAFVASSVPKEPLTPQDVDHQDDEASLLQNDDGNYERHNQQHDAGSTNDEL